ncbi:MAG: hypothetical protein ACR2K2_14835 [Mycobacteriales bacterium]
MGMLDTNIAGEQLKIAKETRDVLRELLKAQQDANDIARATLSLDQRAQVAK